MQINNGGHDSRAKSVSHTYLVSPSIEKSTSNINRMNERYRLSNQYIVILGCSCSLKVVERENYYIYTYNSTMVFCRVSNIYNFRLALSYVRMIHA